MIRVRGYRSSLRSWRRFVDDFGIVNFAILSMRAIAAGRACCLRCCAICCCIGRIILREY